LNFTPLLFNTWLQKPKAPVARHLVATQTNFRLEKEPQSIGISVKLQKISFKELATLPFQSKSLPRVIQAFSTDHNR